MTSVLRRVSLRYRWLNGLIIFGALFGAAYLGQQPSRRFLMLLVVLAGGAALLRERRLGLAALILAALVVPLEFGTGTAVTLNPATLLVPALLVLWLLDSALRNGLRLVPSRANLPMVLFLLAGLLSLLVGNALWDPSVPRSSNFLWVQLAQWAIFAFAAGAFWLMANWARDETWLRRLTFLFLAVGGGLATLRLLPGFAGLVTPLTTITFFRAPFWMLLAALAGGQLLFNRELSGAWRLFLAAVLLAVLAYSFLDQQDATSNWVSVSAVGGILFWLRFPRWRRTLIVLVVLLVASGVLFPSLYEFAGGDEAWASTGGSRLVLIGRVVEVTLRNPITGLGPASYRPYANARPLSYMAATWTNPLISSHNNYVDLFAHTGLVGLGLFLWFMGELGWASWQLCGRLRSGFAGGYAAGMLAAWAGALVLMMFADWILPFVYNIGFPGFQASLLVWLFLGGITSLGAVDLTSGHIPVPGGRNEVS